MATDPTKTGDQLKAAQAEVGALQQAAAAVANTPSSTIGLQNLKNALDRVDKVIDDPRVSGAVAAAAVGIQGISTSIGSLLDNPGRRVISLFLGSLIGLVVVWWLGLDVIHAALNAPLPTQPQDTTLSNLHTLQWGMVATGRIIGLGASPTHDLDIGDPSLQADSAAGIMMFIRWAVSPPHTCNLPLLLGRPLPIDPAEMAKHFGRIHGPSIFAGWLVRGSVLRLSEETTNDGSFAG